MNILFLDFIYPIEHKNFNQNMIKAISNFGNVTVFSPTDYFRESLNDVSSVNIIESDRLKRKKGKFLFRLSTLKSMKESSVIAQKLKPEIIFVSCFETISFAFFPFLFGAAKNIYIVHHNNTDELRNKIKRRFFKSYSNRVKHIVFEDFIKEYLVNFIGVNAENVYVVPHPLSVNILDNTQNSCNDTIDCLGISNSNDEDFIDDIINLEKQNSILKKNGYKLVLRSKKQEFDNGSLKVISGYLDRETYDTYYASCKSVLVPLNKNFCYRMSGTLVDALSNGKVVLGSDVELIKKYSEKYPSLCKKFDSAEDFVDKLHLISRENNNIDSDINEYQEHHSRENIAKTIKAIMIKQ